MKDHTGSPRFALKRFSWAGLMLALIAVLGLPTAAFAAPTTVSLAGATATVTGDATVNTLVISDSATQIFVEDTTQGATPGAGCVADTDPSFPGRVRCDKQAPVGTTAIVVTLDAGADTLNTMGLGEPLTVSGGADNDILEGGSQADTLNGDAGEDTLDGGGSGDLLEGGTEIDTADYDGTLDRTVTLDNVANDGATGENDNVRTENVTTALGNDTLTGDAGPNRLSGDQGNDTLKGLGGGDLFQGGLGIDTVDYSSAAGPVTVTIGGGIDDGEDGTDNVTTTIENVTGGSFDDDITGSTLPNRLHGGVDPDPTLNDGDTGNDTLVGGLGNDILVGFDGNDSLFGQDDADILNGGVGADVMDGGLGANDLVSYAGRPSGVVVNQNGPGGDGQTGEGDDVRPSVERVTGTAFADFIVGGHLNASILSGGGGNDVLNGGNSHNDIVNGGLGNDTINDNGGRDSHIGSVGNDTFHTSDRARDVINCGPGADKSSDRDRIDVRHASC